MANLGHRKLPDNHPFKSTRIILGYPKPPNYDAWKKRKEQEAIDKEKSNEKT